MELFHAVLLALLGLVKLTVVAVWRQNRWQSAELRDQSKQLVSLAVAERVCQSKLSAVIIDLRVSEDERKRMHAENQRLLSQIATATGARGP